MTDRKLEIEVRLAQQGIRADANRAAAVIKGALDGQRFDIDINADDREVKLLQLAIADVADETEKARRQAKFLKEAYDLDDDQIRQVIRKMERLENETSAAKREASGLDAAIAGLAGGAAFAVVDRLVDALTELVAISGEFIAKSIEANRVTKGWDTALNAFFDTAEATQAELDFVRETVDSLGGDLRSGTDAFVDLTAAANTSGIAQQDVRDVFAETSRVLAIFNKDQETSNRALVALSQIAGKGKVSMEELRQQLGEALPVALGATADGLGITVAELDQLVSSGNLSAAEFFPAFAEGLRNIQGEVDGTTVAVGQFNNRIFDLQKNFGAALEPLQNAGLESLTAIFDQAGAQSDGLGKLADSGERLRDALKDNPELVEELSSILADLVDTGVELSSKVLDDISDFLENNPGVLRRQGAEVRKLLADVRQIAPLISQLIGTVVKVGLAAEKNFAAPMRSAGRTAIDVLTGVQNFLGGLIDRFNRLRQAILGAKQEAADLDNVAGNAAAGGATGAADNLTTPEDAQAEARAQRQQRIEEQQQLQQQALQARVAAEQEANADIAESAETVAERQKAAREELKQARLEALQEEFDAEKGALEAAESLLSAQNDLQETLGTLEQERLKTQIAAAEAANNQTAADTARQALKDLEIAQEAKAFEFKRKALELSIQQNRLEAELALAKAKTNDASAEEIALLERQLALVDEIGALDRQELNAQQQIAQEQRKQAEFNEIARANDEAAQAQEQQAKEAQQAQEQQAKEAQREAEKAERDRQRELERSAPTSPSAGVDGESPDGLPTTGPRYFLGNREVSVQEYLGQNTNPLAGVGPNPAVAELGQVAAAPSGGQPNLGELIKPILMEMRDLKGVIIQLASTPGVLNIERFDDQELIAAVLQAYGDNIRAGVNA